MFSDKRITDKMFLVCAFGGGDGAGDGGASGGGFEWGGPGAGVGGASGPGPAGGGYAAADVAAAIDAQAAANAAAAANQSMGQHAVDTLAGIQDQYGLGALGGWQSQGLSASDIAAGYDAGTMSGGFMDALDAAARSGMSHGITSPELAKDIGTISFMDRAKGFAGHHFGNLNNAKGLMAVMGGLVPGAGIASGLAAALGSVANAMGISGANAVNGPDTGPGADLSPEQLEAIRGSGLADTITAALNPVTSQDVEDAMAFEALIPKLKLHNRTLADILGDFTNG